MENPSIETSQHILSNLPMAITIIDDAGLVLWCNETLSAWMGKEPGDGVGHSEAALLNCNKTASETNESAVGNGPYKLGPDAQGKIRRILRYPLPVVDGQYAICYIDITEEDALRNERTQLAKQLEAHNTVELISGLLNEHGVIKGLEPLVSRSRRYQNPLSVVTMEVINLDEIKSTEGQVVADRTIVAVSQLLRDQMRWADLVGRLESEQFIFVLPETGQEAAIALANKLADQLNTLQITVDDNRTIQPTACFGIAAWVKGDDVSHLLKRSAEAASKALQDGVFTVEAV